MDEEIEAALMHAGAKIQAANREVSETLDRLAASYAQNLVLRNALLKCKTCALPTEVRDVVNQALMA